MPPSNTPVPQGPKLLDQVRDRICVKHYSIRTETQYVQWVRRFILFHGKRHPREMGAGEVEAFQSPLAVDGKVAAVTQDKALSALLLRHQPAAACAQATAWVTRCLRQPESGRLRINNPDTAFTHRLPSASRISPST